MSQVWVLVYCLRSHNMFGWHILLGLWNNMWLHDRLFYTLTYLSIVCCMFCVCGFLFLRWSSTYWCEHMRETPLVHREVMVSLCSPHGLDSIVLGLILGLWPMYWLSFKCPFYYCWIFVSGLVWHRCVPWIMVRSYV